MSVWDSRGIVVFPAVESLLVFASALKLEGDSGMCEAFLTSNVDIKKYVWNQCGFELPIVHIYFEDGTGKHWYNCQAAKIVSKAKEFGAMYCVYHQNVSDGDDSEIGCQKKAYEGTGQIRKPYDNLGIQHEAGVDLYELLNDIESAMYHLIQDVYLSMNVHFDERRTVVDNPVKDSVNSLINQS